MKTIAQKSQILLKFSCLFIFFSIMYSCQTETLQEIGSENLSNKKVNSVMKANFLASSNTITTTANCNIDCIKVGGPYFTSTDQQIISWGGRDNDQNVKTVNIQYYNTNTEFVLKVKSTAGWSDLVLNGVSSWTEGPVAPNEWGTLNLPLASGWKACDVKSFLLQIAGNGPQAVFNVDYNLFGVCNDCVTSFTGKAISCGTSREAVYTFKSDKDLSYFKIQGGLTNFTGADAFVTVTGGNSSTVTQSTPGGSSNRIIKIEGSVSKCSEITVRVNWNSTNSGGIITGDWSVSTNNLDVAPAPIAGLTCN